MDVPHIAQLRDLVALVGLADRLRHPRLFLLRAEEVGALPPGFPTEYSFGFYTVGLLRGLSGAINCGRRAYDFDAGTLFCVGPDQLIGHHVALLAGATGWLLFFQGDYCAGHAVAERLPGYRFFDYAVDEALHLSAPEEASLEALFEQLSGEYARGIDAHSRDIALGSVGLLLSYVDRYYHRQFITRQETTPPVGARVERELRDYYAGGLPAERGTPTVAYLAERLHVTPGYLSEQLRALTGHSAQEHIHRFVFERAKAALADPQAGVQEVAYGLGFAHAPYFSRFFRKRAGASPSEWRARVAGRL